MRRFIVTRVDFGLLDDAWALDDEAQRYEEYARYAHADDKRASANAAARRRRAMAESLREHALKKEVFTIP